MHGRAIISEAGGTIAVPFLVLAQTQRDADAEAQRQMRSVIAFVALSVRPAPGLI